MKKKRAFTLSEILITLTLIGVISVLTVPMFIKELQKNKWTVTFKRSFAETINALSRIALDEDCAKSLTCTHIFSGTQEESTETLGKQLTKVLSTNKVCGRTKEEEGCFAHKISIGLKGEKKETLAQTMRPGTDVNFSSPDSPFYTFITNRGVSYAVFSFGTQCLNEPSPYREAYINAYVSSPEAEDNQMLSLCGFIIMDVNAAQPPNIWGRDVFGIWITDRSILGIYPFGGDYDLRFNATNGCRNTENGDTRGCAARVIKDGWVMKY